MAHGQVSARQLDLPHEQMQLTATETFSLFATADDDQATD